MNYNIGKFTNAIVTCNMCNKVDICHVILWLWMTWEVRQGHVLTLLKAMPESSVQCVVTSPPYWGLRSYKTEPQVWGDKWRGELGLEPSPELFVQHLVEVFREVRRVLHPSGTLWLNLGDSYAGSAQGWGHGKQYAGPKQSTNRGSLNQPLTGAKVGYDRPPNYISSCQPNGLKPKDLCGMPWRVAFALQADGWWLRSDIIWHKPNPMPESVTDRPTKAHEYLFLLAKSPCYYFDQEAVREPHQDMHGLERFKKGGISRPDYIPHTQGWHGGGMKHKNRNYHPSGRNLRTVWTIPTQAFPGSHFATFPEKLVEPCLRAGTSEKGCCATCGAPWKRKLERVNQSASVAGPKSAAKREQGLATAFSGYADGSTGPSFRTVGWPPTCLHGDKSISCTVLDPFCGSGTTGVVALKLGRSFIGLELQPEYVRMARQRIGEVLPLFTSLGKLP